MNNTLTVKDLLLPGEPLDPSEVLAGHAHLHNPVSWVVSLRPYSPAFPRLRGGELALVAVDFMNRLDPPTTLSDVIRQLVSRDAAGVAVRGPVDERAVDTANSAGMPLLRISSDVPLPDIEHAIMRACALYQARREMLGPDEPDAWIDDLLAGRLSSQGEALSAARRAGTRLAPAYRVAYVAADRLRVPDSATDRLSLLADWLRSEGHARALPWLAQRWDAGVAVLVPPGAEEMVLAGVSESGLACGIGSKRAPLEAPESLAEARLAEVASALLMDCKPVRYEDLGTDRLLVVLYREQPSELKAFVEDTLGRLLDRDEVSATPLLPTLESFVSHGGRLRETASDIYVHRNTLSYRLDRAAEILGVDLKDPQTRLSIELALRALPLARALRKERTDGR